ncbi:hypothetical protein [Methanosarcina horonobensis]|uniref:hypothetical protein n=1 Tax=Methanosarcina horonobensis TaxID=418008 RepID=UPI000A496E17|nr:hypothetical protein [Methanosarcina horonobensis]
MVLEQSQTQISTDLLRNTYLTIPMRNICMFISSPGTAVRMINTATKFLMVREFMV